MKKISKVCVTVVSLLILIGLPYTIYAGETVVQLPSSDGSDSFVVKEAGSTSLIKVQSDGNVGHRDNESKFKTLCQQRKSDRIKEWNNME